MHLTTAWSNEESPWVHGFSLCAGRGWENVGMFRLPARALTHAALGRLRGGRETREMADAVTVADILVNCATYLSDATEFYWPSDGENEVPEATTVLCLARAFQDAGYLTYAEVQVRGNSREHVDLLAIHPRIKNAYLIEAKRHYSSHTAWSILNDWNRIRSVKLASTYKPQGTYRWTRAVVATNWDGTSHLADRWRAVEGKAAYGGRSEAWAELDEGLRGASRAAFKVRQDPGGKYGWHWLLWAEQPRSSPWD